MLQLTDQICCCLSSPVLLLHVQPTNKQYFSCAEQIQSQTNKTNKCPSAGRDSTWYL